MTEIRSTQIHSTPLHVDRKTKIQIDTKTVYLTEKSDVSIFMSDAKMVPEPGGALCQFKLISQA